MKGGGGRGKTRCLWDLDHSNYNKGMYLTTVTFVYIYIICNFLRVYLECHTYKTLCKLKGLEIQIGKKVLKSLGSALFSYLENRVHKVCA